MKDTDNILNKLAKKTYNSDKVKPIDPRQTMTDEEIKKIFNSMEGNYYEVNELKQILDGKVKVNTDNIKVSVISSTYLFRMSKLTGMRWRQKEPWEKKVKY